MSIVKILSSLFAIYLRHPRRYRPNSSRLAKIFAYPRITILPTKYAKRREISEKKISLSLVLFVRFVDINSAQLFSRWNYPCHPRNPWFNLRLRRSRVTQSVVNT